MTKRFSNWTATIAVVGALTGSAPVFAEERAETFAVRRQLRSSNPELVALIARGTERSHTFSDMVVRINASDGIVDVGRASAHDEPTTATGVTVVLHVVNYAALSRDVLDVAMARVATVYERMGVRIVWVDDTGCVRHRQDRQLHLTVLMLSRDMAEKKIAAEGIKDGVFGQAHVASGRAAIFCDRIATAPGAPTYFPIPLGDVIAHEVGHLVLGANSHSTSGIKRA